MLADAAAAHARRHARTHAPQPSVPPSLTFDQASNESSAIDGMLPPPPAATAGREGWRQMCATAAVVRRSHLSTHGTVVRSMVGESANNVCISCVHLVRVACGGWRVARLGVWGALTGSLLLLAAAEDLGDGVKHEGAAKNGEHDLPVLRELVADDLQWRRGGGRKGALMFFISTYLILVLLPPRKRRGSSKRSLWWEARLCGPPCLLHTILGYS